MDIKRGIKKAQSQLGIEELRKCQVAPINSILNQNDAFIVAPTSAGKSAIYQIPALIFPGVTLVIEPTLSLMYDQVIKLKLHGIKANYIDSSMTISEISFVLKEAQKGNIKFLFVTPERLRNLLFRKEISSVSISLVVVDEAHCVTSWGYGFRSAYLQIGEFIDMLPDSPITVALTATATPQMREEICELLSMDQPDMFINSLYRPNLHFIKRTYVSDEAKLRKLHRMLKRGNYQSCVVYCNTVKMTEAVYKKINEWFPEMAVKCHSNLNNQVRKTNDLMFLSGNRRVIVATSAFGMGVDQSDVDLVMHFNLPLSPVDYYQQAGRAGRTGQKAKCVLLYCENDYHVNRLIINQTSNEAARGTMLAALDQMKEYADSSECLAQQLLSALGEVRDIPCGSCTNCQKRRKRSGDK